MDISSSAELRLTTEASCASIHALTCAGREASSGEKRIALGCCKSLLSGSLVILVCQKKKNATPSTEYASSNKAPSSQLVSASLITDDVTKTAKVMLATSIAVKARSIGWWNTIPRRTNSGAMSSATCMLEPMAMLSARSMRFRIAKMIAELFSAALPMIGIRINPTKNSDSPSTFTASSVADTKISATRPIDPAAIRSTTTAFFDDHFGATVTAGPCLSAAKSDECVQRENTSQAAYPTINSGAT